MNLKKKNNIFIDLDNTIICSEDYDKNTLKAVFQNNYSYDFIDRYITAERPHLQTFLDYIFSNFNVSIWTAANKKYASFIFENFIRRYDHTRHITLLLYDVHCNMSEIKKGGSKNLKMLWDVWKLEGFNKENTFIIDDLKEVHEIQPNNCFKIKQFKITTSSTEDLELLKMMDKLKNIFGD